MTSTILSPLIFLEVNICKICNSKSSRAVLSNIKDEVSDAVAYSGSIFQCENCSHSYLSPVLAPSDLHHAYRGYYTQSRENLDVASNAEYDRFSFFKEFYDYRFRRLISYRGMWIWALSFIIPFLSFFLSRASRFLKIPTGSSPMTLLDVGCGRGDFLIRAARCGYVATGIDFDPKTVEIACARGLDARVAEIHDLSESMKYDAITLSHVLEHVYDPKALIYDVLLRLKPGGYFYLAVPNFDSAGKLTFSKDWRGVDAPRHMHYFNAVSLKQILIEAGFVSVKQVYDLPQSIGVIKSSFKLKFGSRISVAQLVGNIFLLIKHRFYRRHHLDVAVFKCFKSEVSGCSSVKG